MDSGGGISPDKIAIPTWQQGSGVITTANKGSTTLRNGPDVSANANFSLSNGLATARPGGTKGRPFVPSSFRPLAFPGRAPTLDRRCTLVT